MPIYQFKCKTCSEIVEKILPLGHTISKCPVCAEGSVDPIISTPAQIKMADMEKINRRRQRIKEPMWRDLKTGKLTPANP